MSIWILAAVMLVLFGAIGLAKGAVRMTISFIGILLGMLLAVPIGKLLLPLMGPLGVKNPVWLVLVPPLVAFILIYLIVFGLSFLVHHKVYLFFKYKRDDVDRLRWERMNRMVGAAAGVVTGVVFFLLVCGLVYSAGYLTVQISAEENNPASIKFINAVRQDMTEAGFDRAASKFAPAPKLFYDSADVLGLLYHNPLLQSRLANYPYYLSLSERPEIQELANDTEYNQLIFGKAPVTQIIDHARTQAVLGNKDLMDYLKGTDFKDLKEYLRTGVSPKYADQEILGVWAIDKSAILTEVRKSMPDMKAKDLRMLKAAFEMMPPVTLVATPDKKVYFKVAGAAPAAPAEGDPSAEEQPAPSSMDRYRAFAPQPAQPTPAPQPAAPAAPVPQFSGEGTWSEEAGQYLITATDPSGKEQTSPVRIEGDEMILQAGRIPVVFYKL